MEALGLDRVALIHFNITQWRAWAPGLADDSAWADWAAAPYLPSAAEAQPDVSFLPAMQRRRLSPLARMVFSVAWPLAGARAPLPLLFVSRHGETPRTYAILADLARGEPLSPTQFSLSVHNAIIGLWSILRGDTSEMSALAGEGDGLEHAALEAAALLAEGAPAVLLVVAEESPAPAYGPWIDDVPFSHALALLLEPGDAWRLSLKAAAGAEPRLQWPPTLELLRCLHGQGAGFRHSWKNRAWTWQRKP